MDRKILVWLNQTFEETMHANIILLFALVALAYAAVEEDTVDVARVKRGASMPSPRNGARCLKCKLGCRCWSWGYVYCKLTSTGCVCSGPKSKRWGGCQVDVLHKSHMHWCLAEDHQGARCTCNDVAPSKPVHCASE
ncbi:hypothetical protein LSAT2_028857 [Lamellibrachia satsuma]|nr:hypothetical protein LSAT2_028857 [Lamellibrachia satsuma]